MSLPRRHIKVPWRIDEAKDIYSENNIHPRWSLAFGAPARSFCKSIVTVKPAFFVFRIEFSG